MKDYIKAGFGITIGFALAEFAVNATVAFAKRLTKELAKTIDNESEEESEE